MVVAYAELIKNRVPLWVVRYPISPEQFQAILQSLQKSRIRKGHEQEDRARIIRLIGFYNVMYYCGLRSGEASNLMSHSNQIDFEKGLIHIFNREGTKNYPAFRVKDHEARSIPMPTCVVNALVEVQEVAEEGCPYIFLSKHSYERVKRNWHQMVSSGRSTEWQNDMMMNNALRNFKRHCRWAGIKTDKRLSIQELRKGYGTNLANLGTPMQTLKDLMGHSSIVTTMEYYVNSVDANKLKAVAGLDQLMENSTLGTRGGEFDPGVEGHNSGWKPPKPRMNRPARSSESLANSSTLRPPGIIPGG